MFVWLTQRLVCTDPADLFPRGLRATGIPWLAAPFNTEWPITIGEGMSALEGNDSHLLRERRQAAVDDNHKPGHCPALWAGHAAERIATFVEKDGNGG